MINKIKKISIFIKDSKLSFETGIIAKNASNSVWITWGKSSVLVTLCYIENKSKQNLDFLPLTCEYSEKKYSIGKIPGGFFKRELRPGDMEILTSRLMDRSIRPLIESNNISDIQIFSTVLSYDNIHQTDMMSICGASLLLTMSDLSFNTIDGPISGIRFGRIQNKIIINPTNLEKKKSTLDFFITSSSSKIIMVEGSSKSLSRKNILKILKYALLENRRIISKINSICSTKIKDKYIILKKNKKNIKNILNLLISNILIKINKIKQINNISVLCKKIIYFIKHIKKHEQVDINLSYLNILEKNIIQYFILFFKSRLDSRTATTIRPIYIQNNILKRSHGSTIFTRGETQAIVSTTIGIRDDEIKVDSINGDKWKRFYLHYNFPPYSVGEVRNNRGTSRREIGHASLAEKALKNVLPSKKIYPYTVRIVSEITESNGSSSMATVCGGYLSMLNSGIPISKDIAGVAMGVIEKYNKSIILSDINGEEDHIGSMDFKICGSPTGFNTIQIDIKNKGLSFYLINQILLKSKKSIKHIINKLKSSFSLQKKTLLSLPLIHYLKINPKKIGSLIGSGGKNIKYIMNKSKSKIDIQNNGNVEISVHNQKNLKMSIDMILSSTREPILNMVYYGKVTKVLDFGAFVEIYPGKEGLCHISELSNKYIRSARSILKENSMIYVTIINIDKDRIRLSRKKVFQKKIGMLKK